MLIRSVRDSYCYMLDVRDYHVLRLEVLVTSMIVKDDDGVESLLDVVYYL